MQNILKIKIAFSVLQVLIEHLYPIPHSIRTTIIIQLKSLGSLLPGLASEEYVFTFNRINGSSQSYCQLFVCLSFESDLVNRVGKISIFPPMFELCNVVLPPCGSFIVSSETRPVGIKPVKEITGGLEQRLKEKWRFGREYGSHILTC